MPQEKMTEKPDFCRIFQEIAQKNERSEMLIEHIENINEWNSLIVIKMNEKVVAEPGSENLKCNQKHKSYDEYSINELQKSKEKNHHNNAEMMCLGKASVKSISKWKKMKSLNYRKDKNRIN